MYIIFVFNLKHEHVHSVYNMACILTDIIIVIILSTQRVYHQGRKIIWHERDWEGNEYYRETLVYI